ncbi:MAG: T9SS type A sorting domain-containing protein [Bacteroidetes bacterium]|nr:T9SS type A sorting domain-containing protein [Bacteroidota bacterium]
MVNYYPGEISNYTLTPSFTPAPVANDAEPNGTFATANTFPLNSTTTGHCHYYFNNEKDTLDWYTITTTVSGQLSWTISSQNGNLIFADLINGDGVTLITGNFTSNTLTQTANGLAAGTYYLRLHTFYDNQFVPYTLSNTFTAPTYSTDPEPNETAATATSFPLNGSVVGQIGYRYNGTRDNYDWWAVNVNADGRLNVTLTVDNGQNTYAQLFDGDAVTLLAGSYTTTVMNYSKDGLAPGTYYILVQTFYVDGFSSYSLTNNLVVPVQPVDVGSNNVFANAGTLPLNGSATGHIGYRYNGTVDTTDWLKVTLPSDGKLEWTLAVANGQNVHAMLYDGNGISFLAGSYTTTTNTYSKNGLAAGTFYLKFYTFYDTEFAPYTISNVFTPSPLTNDSEPNSDAASANTIVINSTVTGHIGYFINQSRDTADYHKIVLPVDGKLTYTITSQNGANVYAVLYDNNGTTYLAGSYTSSSVSFSRNDLAAGTYYIGIKTFYDIEFTSYTLSNSFEPMTFLAEVPGNNSSALQGTLLPANTNTGGHIAFYYNLNTDTYDWWKIGYDGAGTMDLHLDLEQNHFNTDYPYINYRLYSDTNAAPILSGTAHAATNTFSLSGLSVGVYYLLIDPGFGTFGAYRLNATYQELCANTVDITSSAQEAGCNGTITYDISGGLAPYTVQLYKDGLPSGSPQTTNGTITFSSLGLGTYYARSYSFGASGICNNVSSDITFSSPVTPTITPQSTTTFCQGGSVTLSSSAAASYLWSTGATTQSIVVSSAGNYSVTTFNAAGCESIVSSETTVTVNPLPAIPTISAGTSTTFCQGGSVTLTSTPATSYLWSTGSTLQSISVNSSGTYSVIITNANGCTSSSAGTIVTVNPLPATPVISAGGPTTFCQGGSVTLTSTSGTTYLWNTGATTQAISAIASGSYTVRVTNANGCSATSSSTTVIMNPLPAVSLAPFSSVCNTNGAFALTGGSPAGGSYSGTGVSGGMFDPGVSGVGTFEITYSYSDGNGCNNFISQSLQVTNCSGCTASISPAGPTTFCDGGSVVLNSSAGVSYLWNTGATSQSITASSSGTYIVAVTDANNCTATASVVVTETTPVIASSSSSAIVCSGGSATVTVSATGGTAPYSGTGTFTRTAGTYSFTVTDANNCSASTTITITEPTAVVASSSATPILCNGGTSTVTVSATGGTAPYSGTGTFTRAAGTWSFTVSDANGCSTSTSVTITEPTALNASAVASGTILCFGATTNVNVSATGGTAPYSGTGTFNQGAGTISYSVTDANGCTSSSPVTLTQPTKVEGVTSSTAASGCSIADGTASVVVSGGTGSYTYLWSDGQTTSTANGLVAGPYSVTFTDANGCTGSATVTVSGSGGSIGTPGAISGAQGACRNTSGIVYSVSAVPGATSYTWTLPTGVTGSSTTNSITVAFTNSFNGGFICVAANNACGSSMSSCQNIPVITTYPSQPAVITGPAVACGPGVYTYSTTSANALSYNWVVTGSGLSITSGIGTNTIQLTVAAGFTQGSLQVRGVNCNGSSAVRGMTITGIPAHSNAVSGPSFVCANGSATYSMPVVNGVTTYTWSITGGATLGSQTTNATTTSATFNFGPTWNGGTVTITASNSCGSFARTFAVRSTPAQPGGITGPGTAVCGASNVSYSIAPVAGATSYSWTVPGGVSIVSTAPNGLSIVVNFTIAFTSTGNICVTANNSCGQGPARCFTITARPAVPIISGPASVCKTQSSVAYSISPVSGATSYSWSATGGASISPSGNTALVNYNTALSSSVVIRANANNACGSSQPGALGVNVNLFCRSASENVDENSTSFEVYPNPASANATITFNSLADQKYVITLTDMIGNIVYSDAISATKEFNSMEINVADLAKGVYILSIKSEKGGTESQRIQVQ